MTTFLRNRNRKRHPRFVLIEPTQRWRLVDGEFFRVCLVEDGAGQRRLVGVRDDLVASA